ncbi:lysylphosphatidylglycerol synthase transmembrane domain-containing protein [Arthrobacter alpinus]|uniref:lysylphosphatidylglycerol synthase transmembrane domain-containing protein n=1 Tax=Arthrobacter alpinus TaxID=656366 RepID=UPI0021BD5014|nr:lysylphosphatidylglycerol synthase transmembrane domain-containing protein [Arthrobacter alpinus]
MNCCPWPPIPCSPPPFWGPGGPSYFTILRIDLAGLAVNHVVPGGGATAAAARFRLLHRAGVRSPNALSAAFIEVTSSNLVLGAICAVGLLMTLTTAWSNGYYRTAAIAILAALLVTGTGIWFLTRRTEATVVKVHAVMRLVPLISAEVTGAFLRMMAAQIRYLGRNPRKMAFDLIFAAANWILDAAALWLVLSAFGHNLGLGPLLTVYGAGNILATLPLTPGGLGLVEGVMVPALLGFGTPAGVALLGVIGWRLLQFWMLLPLGAAAYLSLTLGTFEKTPTTAIRVRPQQFQRRRCGTLKRAAVR